MNSAEPAARLRQSFQAGRRVDPGRAHRTPRRKEGKRKKFKGTSPATFTFLLLPFTLPPPALHLRNTLTLLPFALLPFPLPSLRLGQPVARWTSSVSWRSIAAEAADINITLLFFCDLIRVDLLDRSAYPLVLNPKHEGAVERRKLPRYEVQLPVSFSGNEVAGGGVVTNLSKEGCTVASEELVLPHAFLELRLQLSEQDAPLKVEVAEVRWGSGMGFGLEFIQLRAEEQERLQRFITFLEASQNN